MTDKYDMTLPLILMNCESEQELGLILEEFADLIMGWQMDFMESLFKRCLIDEDFPGAFIIPKGIVGLWKWRFDKGLAHIPRCEKQAVLDKMGERSPWFREILKGALSKEEE